MSNDSFVRWFSVYYYVTSILVPVNGSALNSGDSLIELVRSKRAEIPERNGSCVLPNHPKNGQWKIRGVTMEPNTTVDANTIIIFSCNPAYKITPNQVSILVCLDDGWSAEPPTCARLCPPLYSTNVTHVTCYNKNQQVVNCNETTSGSSAKFKCDIYYESTDRVDVLRLCIDGSWNYPIPQCVPGMCAICGIHGVTDDEVLRGEKSYCEHK